MYNRVGGVTGALTSEDALTIWCGLPGNTALY